MTRVPLRPDDPAATALGERLFHLGFDQLGERVLRRALDHGPAPADRRVRLARWLLRAGRPAAAAEVIREVPGATWDLPTRLVAAETALHVGEWSAAAAEAAAVEAGAGDAAELLARAVAIAAQAALHEGEPEAAAEHLQRGLGRHPLPLDAGRTLADLAGLLPTWPAHQATLEEQRRAHGGDSGPHYLLARLLAAAQAHHSPGIPDTEIERLLGLALRRDGGNHRARLMLGLRLARRRFLSEEARDQALGTFKFLSQALRLAPDALGVDAGLIDLLIAAMLDESPRTAREAVDFYLAGLRRLPGNAVAANNLGVLYLARGEVGAARRWFLTALALAPDYDPAHVNLVRTLPAGASPDQVAREVASLVASLAVPAAEVTGRIVAAMAEDARGQVLEALHTKARQLFNQLGVVQARLHSEADAAGAPSLRLAEIAALLDALRSEWGQYVRLLHVDPEAPPEVLGLNLLVTEVVRDVTGRDPRRVVVQATAALPQVKGHRGPLSEALAAILQNGLEAQPPASPPLAVVTRPFTPLGTRVVVEVRDYGPGISALHRAHLFVPGFSTKRDRSGFGLSLARRIITAHRGWIEVSAADGSGTMVRVVLPTDLHGLPALLEPPPLIVPVV
jgi:signal transduction histidine kinase